MSLSRFLVFLLLHFKSLIAYRLLLIAYHLPLIAYRLPLTAYSLPLTAYRLPLTTYRLLLIAYRLSLIAYCYLSFSRISTRRIFPLMVFGSSLTNSMMRGYL